MDNTNKPVGDEEMIERESLIGAVLKARDVEDPGGFLAQNLVRMGSRPSPMPVQRLFLQQG